MKKLSVKQRQTAIWRAQGASRKARTPLQAEVNQRRVIEAPSILSFGTSYDETAKFLASVRRAVDGSARDRSLLLVDPKRVREMDPAAALCLTAEMDRWQRQAEGLRLAPTTIEAWHKKFIRQLADMGFFALLGSPVPQKLRSGGPGSARWIRFCSDDTLRPETSANFKRSIEPHVGAMSPFGLSLYRSLQEAIGNAIEHAYPEGARNALSPVGNRWWLTGAVDIKRRRLRVIVLDHGVSIPAVLGSKHTKPFRIEPGGPALTPAWWITSSQAW